MLRSTATTLLPLAPHTHTTPQNLWLESLFFSSILIAVVACQAMPCHAMPSYSVRVQSRPGGWTKSPVTRKTFPTYSRFNDGEWERRKKQEVGGLIKFWTDMVSGISRQVRTTFYIYNINEIMWNWYLRKTSVLSIEKHW